MYRLHIILISLFYRYNDPYHHSDHSQGSFEEYGDIKDNEYEYEEDDSKRTRKKRFIPDWTQRTCKKYFILKITNQLIHSIYSFYVFNMCDYTMWISDCSGSLELTSTHHNFMKIVSAEKLRRHDRTVKLIRARNPETKSRLQFEIVTATGNCAWTVHENRRGGRKKRISPVDTIFTEWPIKRVKLLEE